MGGVYTLKAVLAIDPGITTGLALLQENNEIITKATKNVYEVFTLIKLFKPDVVCEDFTTSGRISSYGLHTVRLIGGVQAMCWYLGLRCVMRMPQERYSHMAASKVHLKGTKHVVHEVDALAHLLKHMSIAQKGPITWKTIQDLM